MIRAFVRSPSGVLGLVAVMLIFVVAAVGPALFADQAADYDVTLANSGPIDGHPLGTDPLGRDILLRTVVATRTSVGLALLAASVAALVGITTGLLIANARDGVRNILMRALDMFLAFPGILIAIFIVAVAGPGPIGAVIGVATAVSVQVTRIASTLALTISSSDFVQAGRLLGLSRSRLLGRYILANIAETLIIIASVAVTNGILFISSLSFLGLGIQEPQYDWGRMLTEGVRAIYTTPMAALAPAVAIGLSALSFGLLGEALARSTNPKLWTRGKGRRAKWRPEIEPTEPRPVYEAVTGGDSRDRLVEVRDMNVAYETDRERVYVVRGVSFTVDGGATVGIVGESGSGKSTLVAAIANLITSDGVVSGSVTLKGRELSSLSGRDLRRLLGREVGMVFQDPISSLNPALRVKIQLIEGALSHREWDKRFAAELAEHKLADVGIKSPSRVMNGYPFELSGGMRQRVAVAMGTMTEPSLLIADEPTTALDVTTQAQLMRVLRDMSAENETALILISHDLPVVTQVCDRVLVMYGGMVVEDIQSEDLLGGAVHPYTRALLAVSPDLDSDRSMDLAVIPEVAVDPVEGAAGCPFAPRCAHAMDRCRTDVPVLQIVGSEHSAACWLTDERANS